MSLSRHLSSAAKTGRLPHAVLLTGASGLALRSQALLLAATYNCEAPEDTRPCRVAPDDADGDMCLSCRKTMTSIHPDVTVLDCAEGAVPVERVRGMCASLSVLPNEGRFKPYIIYDAQLLSPVCQNALLTALEEPPSRVVFVLTCVRTEALLPTVLSRLTRWDAGPDGSDAEYSPPEDIAVKAGDILDALDKNDELALLLAAMSCDTLSREQVSALLDALRAGLLERCKTPDDSDRAGRLLDAAAGLGDLQNTLSHNAGVGHLCGAAAVRLSSVFI